jgi:hypothetical protein
MENNSNLAHEREVKQLKEVIDALRQELEKGQSILANQLQVLRQEYSSEIGLLKDTIFALNSTLGEKDQERQQSVQEVTRANESERKDHIGMINELRAELERERHRRDQLIQEKTLSLTQQVDELKQTANVLRQKIENQ